MKKSERLEKDKKIRKNLNAEEKIGKLVKITRGNRNVARLAKVEKNNLAVRKKLECPENYRKVGYSNYNK